MNVAALLNRISSPRLRSWAERVTKFLLGQGAVQALNLVTGFLLVRWLSVTDYAQFGVVFGFQVTLSMFVDLGFSGCIIALVGGRGSDPAVLGRYVATARSLRLWSMLVVVPLAAAAFVWIGQRQGWDPSVQLLLFGLVVAGIFFEGIITYNGSTLLIHQRIGTYYRAPVEAAVGRLAACSALRLGGGLWILPLCVVNVLATAWQASRFTQAARLHLDPSARPDAATRREMLRYLSPLVPGLIFTAFQGQILVFLSSIFAGSQQVAELTALGRLGQIFVLLSAVNGTLISPYFAQLPAGLVGSRYLRVLAGATLLCALLAALGFLVPQPLLWLLGPTYAHLQAEIGWTLLGSVTAFLGTVMWAVNSARKWIFWWSSIFYIVMVTTGQAAFLSIWGAGTTRTLLYLSIFTNVLIMLVHLTAAWQGLRQEARSAVAHP
ncbi:MAG: oligosaccharide flippase family protein [Verrucomicrobia bacterium]|nr:oligosaccharide flippase family protein [Verrucomicrobiota bacterium]